MIKNNQRKKYKWDILIQRKRNPKLKSILKFRKLEEQQKKKKKLKKVLSDDIIF